MRRAAAEPGGRGLALLAPSGGGRRRRLAPAAHPLSVVSGRAWKPNGLSCRCATQRGSAQAPAQTRAVLLGAPLEPRLRARHALSNLIASIAPTFRQALRSSASRLRATPLIAAAGEPVGCTELVDRMERRAGPLLLGVWVHWRWRSGGSGGAVLRNSWFVNARPWPPGYLRPYCYKSSNETLILYKGMQKSDA